MLTLALTDPGVASKAFFQGSTGYNIVSFVVSSVGTVLGIVALWIALVQLRKIRRATEAAAKAATDTADKILQVVLVMDLSKLSSLSNEATILLQESKLDAAQVRIRDLKLGVITARTLPRATVLALPEVWTGLVTQLGSMERSLRSGTEEIDPDVIADRCLKKLEIVVEQLHELAARAAAEARKVANAS